jgi:Spy/CpxP family protein refolding chaperone
MNRIRRAAFLTITAAFAVALCSWAQFPMSKEAMIQEGVKRMDMIAKKLNLSPDQIAKIKPLLSDQLEKTFAAREKFAASDRSNASKQEAVSAIEQARASTRDQVKDILNPDQLKKWGDLAKNFKNDLNFKGIPKDMAAISKPPVK